MYYQSARSGRDAKDRVSYSTRREAEGQKIDNLAVNNQQDVDATLKAVQAEKRREHRPVELKRRDGTGVSSEQDATPVPSIAVPAPALPALPPPNSEPNQSAAPDSTSQPNSQTPQPQNPNQS
jgi:hypothetical protein